MLVDQEELGSKDDRKGDYVRFLHALIDSFPNSFRKRAKQIIKNKIANMVVRMLAKAFFGRSQRGAVRYLLMRIPVSGRFRVRLPDGKFLLIKTDGSYADPLAKELFWWGFDGHEPETAKVFYELAKRSSTVFDIGANIGYFTLLASLANEKSQVVAFEPSPRHFAWLRANILLNNVTNVAAVQGAVSSEDGSLMLYLTEDGGTSSVVSDFREQVVPIEVPSLSLDSYVAQNRIGKVDLIKIDVESGEPAVFEGMRTLLKNDQPILICEVLGSTEHFLNGFLSGYGYDYYWITPNRLQKRSVIAHDEKYQNLNYLFAKGNLHAWGLDQIARVGA